MTIKAKLVWLLFKAHRHRIAYFIYILVYKDVVSNNNFDSLELNMRCLFQSNSLL